MNWFRKAMAGLKARGGLSRQDYVIGNAEKLRDENPRSFSIPRSDQRRSLRVGDTAKIILEATASSGPISAERPWVTVTEVGNGGYKVEIDNSLVLFPSLNGAILSIRPEHVISVTLPDEYVLPYSKTCLVSAGIVQDAAWPHRLVRVSQKGDADSGWRILEKGASLTDELQEVSCGAIIAQYQVLDSVMDEPGLCSWIWNDRENEFARESA